MIRLAGGFVAGRGLRVWASGAGGIPVDAATTELPAGTPVALGPYDADSSDVAEAVTELLRLVTDGGAAAAGASVDLFHGFRSARLEGARGEPRDAILAALPVLGMAGLHRLGDRAGVLIALFGPAATKPVGAAALRAMTEGRWAALGLASAASDLLGPEQIERVLDFAASTGIDPLPQGTLSTVADQLGRILDGIARPRRLRMLEDLWGQVCQRQATLRRRDRLKAAYCRSGRVARMRERYNHHDGELLLQRVRGDLGREPTVLEAARWLPSPWYWAQCLNRLLADARCATVLVRTAIAVSDHGMADGLAAMREQIAFARGLIDDAAAGHANRRVRGLAGVPARPGCYLRDLDAKLSSGRPIDAATEAYVRQRLASAHDYAVVVCEAAELISTIADQGHEYTDPLEQWSNRDLATWRAVAGYPQARPPASWDSPPVFVTEPAPTLAARLREGGDSVEEVERVGDLLWYADLADALAELHGHPAAEVGFGRPVPSVDWDPTVTPVPLVPSADSLAQAIAGAAQLVSLGAAVPPKCRTWTELVAGLLADAAIAEALTGQFQVPGVLSNVDGTAIPGTRTRLELARDPRTLAEWSNYMGNCIAGPYYIHEATQGRSVLAAVRDSDGVIVANVELRHTQRGWHVAELRARFNTDPETELQQRVTQWVTTLPPARPGAEAGYRPVRSRGGRRGGVSAASRMLREVADPLTALARQQLSAPATGRAAALLAVALPTTGSAAPHAALTALRRLGPTRLAAAYHAVLAESAAGSRGPAEVTFAKLWWASGVRPMATAIAGLEPASRLESLDRLCEDAPLLGTLRTLARRPVVGEARTMDLVALRARAALGTSVLRGDPAALDAFVRGPSTDAVCALLLAVNSWAPEEISALRPVAVAAPGAVHLPGFPASALSDEDGPWHGAWPHAHAFGAQPEPFWNNIATRGLLVPSAWLRGSDWAALWSQAARVSSRLSVRA